MLSFKNLTNCNWWVYMDLILDIMELSVPSMEDKESSLLSRKVSFLKSMTNYL
jgi:hypothetical protein